MPYQNFYYNKRDGLCHLWTDNGYEVFPYEPYAYQLDQNGEYQTLTGLKVKKVKSWTPEQEKHGLIFEHDIPVATRVLIDRYYESDEPSKNHRIVFFDIEVEKGLRYSTVKETANKITSIAYFYDGKYVCLLLDENQELENSSRTFHDLNVDIKRFNSEKELLINFLVLWNKISPTIITGWNIDLFDVPYLYNRIGLVLGWKFANKLSPIGIVNVREINKKDIVCKIAGVSSLDYIELYKKFTYNEEPSYALDYICKKELKRGKYVYDGTLDRLYKENIDGFIEYNVNDVELVVALDKKLDLIEIARGICHAGHVPYDDYQFSSRYLEGALLTYCKRENLISFATDKVKNAIDAEGAFVKPPKSGLYKYCYDLDLESEYPNNIKTLNISPETKWGRIIDYNLNDFVGNVNRSWKLVKVEKTHISDLILSTSPSQTEMVFQSSDELRSYLTDNRLSISSAGIIYDTTKKGIIPTILTVWGDTRTEYRKIAKQKHEQNDHESFVYYDRKQLIQKILLNSLYGVLLLPSFRYYDRENGESVTLTGQSLVQWSAHIGNVYYQKQMNSETYIDYCIYQDTDSCFFESLPLIEYRYPNNNFTDQEFVQKTLEIAKEVEDVVNRSYLIYANKYHCVKNHTWKIKQEMVGRRAFWGSAKKRYAMHIINKNSIPVDEIEVKGLDIVRSSFPKIFRKEMNDLIHNILHDVTLDELNSRVRAFKNEYFSTPINDILLPTSVKDMGKYRGTPKGTPIHVKSAQNYNKLLDLFQITSMPPIDDGDKILYGYLQKNPYGFETLALKGFGEENPPEIIEFLEKYVDRDKIFKNTFLSKLETIWTDLGWGQIKLEENNDFF